VLLCVQTMIKVILADDHAIIRQGLRLLIEMADDIQLVAECGDGLTALKLVKLHKPDVTILDIAMPHLDGLTLASQLIESQCPTAIIILTTHDDPVLYQQAQFLGVNSFISKVHAFEILLESIRQASVGIKSITAHNNGDNYSDKAMAFKITEREREVLKLISHGMTNRMIAEHLGISMKTVDRHRTNLMNKLDIHSTAHLSRFALQTGLS